ncbi:MAG TPA: hypothetical protein VFD97_04830 [Acidimicrobiia bacterium]|nr:hypothetical protein [Acidimicrobiia bacterium]
MATTRVLVHVDGARKREGLELLEGVIGEQDPPVRARLERPQAKPAGAVAGRDVGESGMTPPGSLTGVSDLSCDSFLERYHTVTVHGAPLIGY